jgi:hypothetical protein
MEIEVKRIALKPDYTIGKLYVDGIYYCDTIEDQVRPEGEKVWGETAIPAGRYKIILSHSSRFKKTMPYLVNVPDFSGIMIHNGNTAEDTHGCILVGENKVKGKVINSVVTFKHLMSQIEGAINSGETVYITIQ